MNPERTEDWLELIARLSAINRGADFFPAMVAELQSVLGVAMCFVSRAVDDPPTRLSTLAVNMDGQARSNFEYAVAGVPCEKVLRNGIYYCQAEVQTNHPADAKARELGMESYIGVTLLGADDRILGHLAVEHREPLADLSFKESIIRVFAARAAAELENTILFERLKQNESILRQHEKALREEMHVASRLQRRLLPRAFPDRGRLNVAALYHPVKDVAGDFYDVIETDTGIGIFICDVSGHGMPAALIAAMIKMGFSEAAQGEASPARMLERLNASLYGKMGGHFCTAFYCLIDPDRGQMRFARAGHIPPLLYDGNNGEWTELQSRGMLLGAFESVKLEEGEHELRPGQRLLIYTDGVSECAGGQPMFEVEDIVRVLAAHTRTGQDATLTALVGALNEFSGERLFEDDITALLIELGDS